MCSNSNDIRKSFAYLRGEKKMRHHEIAKFLQISEAQLIDAHVGISKVDVVQSLPNIARAVRLKNDWPEILRHIEALGEVLALTRNKYGVHEKICHYENISLQSQVGQVSSAQFDLRLLYKNWEFAYLFEENKANVLQKSIQFFDECGVPVHKIFLLPISSHVQFEYIENFLADSSQESGILVEEKYQEMTDEVSLDLSSFDYEAFKLDWNKLKEGNHFYELLKKYQINRLQAFELVGEEFAEPLEIHSVKFLLDSVVHFQVPIKLCVGNRGAIQTYKGPLRKVLESNAWLSVLDPYFNLHLSMSEIGHIWLVRKPSQDGILSSMELLDHQGNVVAILLGDKSVGLPEPVAWRDLLEACRSQEMVTID